MKLSKLILLSALCAPIVTSQATSIIYADGDVAPLGAPNGVIDVADFLITSRIANNALIATDLELSHGDIYPAGKPDGVINLQDLLLMTQRVINPGDARFIENLALFEDGLSTFSGEVDGVSGSSPTGYNGYIGPGAIVTNDPYATDPDNGSNTAWHFSVSGGIANAYITTGDLSAHPVLDNGFDLSGSSNGMLVFDIKVMSISPGAVITAKIDSGYPDLGQHHLSAADYSIGQWQRVSISFAELLADPGPGAGLNLSNVVNPFIIEVTGGSADFYLDNIFISNACATEGSCHASINTKPSSADEDGDGVLDINDLCPSTAPGSTVDADGCLVTNALLSATATASSTGAAGSAGFAIDGNISTRWESEHNIDPSWITLDLGSLYQLSEVIIHWEAANAATYQIQGSQDNSSWTTLSSVTGGTFGDRTDNVTVTGAHRYVRMFGQTRTSVYGYSIWEMEVYGTPASDTDGDGIADSLDLCPNTPPGSNIDADGCVIIDSDHDGVPDGSDQCPGTTPSAVVDAVGCEIVIAINEVTAINDLLAGGSGSSQPGLTLYTFDNDLASPGNSVCNDGCASNWPPLLVDDGFASGVSDLGTITRNDGNTQATYDGRPLYFFAGDSVTGDTNGQGSGGVWWTVPYTLTYIDLYDTKTVLEPAVQENTPTALITRLADRARDRHHREGQFQQYDHYLSFYWEHRTAEIEIIDTVGKGGNSITFNVITEWPLHPLEAELRFFHLNAAIYANNGIMTAVPTLDIPGEDRRHYTRTVSHNSLTNQPLQLGDRMEFELSQFLTGTPNGRDNYYGTAILYVVGQGVEPWQGVGTALNPEPMPPAGRLGGDTTLSYQYSNEPDNHFQQMSTNLSNINGQIFVLGRRVLHTDFGDGSHDEAAENSNFTELAGKLGTNYINRSCSACHVRNGRAIPPATGQTLSQYVVSVGDNNNAPHPTLGRVLQPQVTSGNSEGGVTLASWNENGGLRSPVFNFSGTTPAKFSARIAPQLVGMGLLEAISEDDIAVLADPNDANSDGISGRIREVVDPVTGESRIGRFGWKAALPSVRTQVAAALNTDIGVMNSVFPSPDCGTSQTNCGPAGSEIDDEHLDDLSAYIALLGVSARRDLADAEALQGETLFQSANCNVCHVESFQTSPYHPHAELRNQTISPYTDLLLHDMGAGLASTLEEDGANNSEWRTAPLWNIGLTAGVSGGEAYLHDGRARTLTEAILWHGGEAAASKAAFEAMTATEKAALIKFMESL